MPSDNKPLPEKMSDFVVSTVPAADLAPLCAVTSGGNNLYYNDQVLGGLSFRATDVDVFLFNHRRPAVDEVANELLTTTAVHY